MSSKRRFHELTPSDFFPDEEEEGEELPNTTKRRIKKVVKRHPDGVAAPEVAGLVDVAESTARRHLNELKREREVYSRKVSDTTVWYPNGELIHPYLRFAIDLKGKTYRFSVQEGRSGPLVQIQERSYSLLDGESVEGAIFVEYDELDGFAEALEELRTRFETYQRDEVEV